MQHGYLFAKDRAARPIPVRDPCSKILHRSSSGRTADFPSADAGFDSPTVRVSKKKMPVIHVSHGVSADWRNRVQDTCTINIDDSAGSLLDLVRMAEAAGMKPSKVSVEQESDGGWPEDGTRLVLSMLASDCKLCRANTKKNAKQREAVKARNAERRRQKLALKAEAEQQRAPSA